MAFYVLSVIYPLTSAYLLLLPTENKIVKFYDNLSVNINDENKLIGLAFIIVTLATNLYAISQKRKFEVFVGSVYSFCALIGLFAGDFISLFAALEIMMLLASILIFCGQHKNSTMAARQYFLTHLLASTLILIGISYIINQNSSIQIIPLTTLIETKSSIFYFLILSGYLINIAVPPFSGWMVNCYPYASSSGIIYLTSFTSKVAIIIILKLFSGLEILKFFGLLMIIYGGIYACIEDNIKRVICYLTISQLGFMLIAIGTKSDQIACSIPVFLFLHICYKALFSLYVAILTDKELIENFSDIKIAWSIKNPLLLGSLLLSILLIISFPIISSFTIKLFITSILSKDISYYGILFLKIITPIAVFSTIKYKNISRGFSPSLSVLTKLSLFTMLLFTLIISVWLEQGFKLLNLSYPLSIYKVNWQEIIDQLLIILIAILLTKLVNRIISRHSTSSINLDLFRGTEKVFHMIYFKYHHKITQSEHWDVREEYNIFNSIDKTTLRKIKSLHNQSTSLFIIMTLLIMLTIYLSSRMNSL
ncbi:proton-conducting transporter membrane subunit [Candidatus Tisiphia endosymbiont of Nemotelus uliginosus]|uniref:proton-conducting transporter transmembrane domain-containing protein n=1 Tax=Candidatus Tisiphia endosymbiont of Nemotelus uliginosus TaxID=3077926 RepID=UPI0035C88013